MTGIYSYEPTLYTFNRPLSRDKSKKEIKKVY